MNAKIFIASVRRGVILALLLLLVGCTARIDFFGVLEEKNAPDIAITIGESSILANGSGFYDFGSVQIETSKTTAFTIENRGLMPLIVSGVSISSSSGGQFGLTLNSSVSTLAPGCSATFSITFSPSVEGHAGGMVTVTNDDPDEPEYTFTIEGYGSPIPVPDLILENGGSPVSEGSLAHDFGTVLLGDICQPVRLSVRNGGTADLDIDSISFSEGAVSDYLIEDSSTSYSVQPGEITTFDIVFSPLDAGEKTATVTIHNNDPEQYRFSFTVTGTGEPRVPDVYVESGSGEIQSGSTGFDFGTVKLGHVSSLHQFVIGNRGTGDLHIASMSSTDPTQFPIDSSGTTFTLAPGMATGFAVSFEPVGSQGFKTAEIVLHSDDPDTGEFRFTVLGYASPLPVPDIEVKRGTADIVSGSLGYDFGAVEGGHSSLPVTFTIRNSGDADLTVLELSSSTGDFSLGGAPVLPCDISAGGSRTFTVIFSPSGSGLATASITIMNDDPDEHIFTFRVEGRTALPLIGLLKGTTPIENGETDAHDFGIILIGDVSAAAQFTIKNNGEADLSIGTISLAGGDTADFALDRSATASTVPAGGSTSFSVSFAPTVTGHRQVTISIVNGDTGNSPYTFSVDGEGEPKVPDIHVRQGTTNLPSGSTHDFGTVLIGSESSVQFSIRNNGTGDLTVYGISSSSGEFVLSSAPTTPFSVAPGGSRYFTVGFHPSASGERTAVITISSSDPDAYENPYSLGVRGYGETPAPQIAVSQGLAVLPNGSGIFFFGHVQEGDSKTETFTIKNNGTASLIVSGILLTGGNTDQFSINYSIPPIAPGGSGNFTITFAPTFSGDKWSQITIVTNDPDDDLYTFLVEGMVGLPPVVDIEVWEGATCYPDGAIYSGFGSVSVGGSSLPVVFTIRNNGPDDLLIPSITITAGDVADFDLDLNSTFLNDYIPPGWSTTFTVIFSPQGPGVKQLQININYNDPVVTPYTLRFEGTGED